MVRLSLPRPEPAADSPASYFAELARRERGSTKIADQVIVVATLWTLIAGDQLYGLAALIRSRAVFALFPVLRASIEHSCLSIWVLDPDPTVTPEVRCARAALATERSHEELVNAAAHLGGKQSDVYKEHRRMLKAFRADIAQQFPEGTDIDKKVIAGQRLASPTEVMHHYGSRWGDAREWEGIYGYLCATANHPTLAANEFLVATPEGLRIDFPLESLERFLRLALIPYLKALEHYAVFCGWDRSGLAALMVDADQAFSHPLFR